MGLALAVVACAGDPPSSVGPTSSDPAPASPDILPDAIRVGPELYMRPMGTDERGCPVFQPWSPTLAVVQALHWRTAEGDFTLDRSAAACPADDAP